MKLCKICQLVEIKNHRTYCSNACKFSDKELNQKRAIKEKNDPNKIAKCKLDGKEFSDEKNLGGHLSKYSNEVLLKEFDWNDWEIINKPIDNLERWNCPHCDWSGKSLNGRDNGGWIGNHLSKVHGIDKIKHINQFPNDEKLWPVKIKRVLKLEHINSNDYNRVQCLECGEYFAKLSNTHLLQKHGITTKQYQTKYPNAKIQSQELTDIAKGV